MTCEACGQGVPTIVKQSGGTESGRFHEVYKCNVCGAKGTIRGEASDPPSEWTRVGRVFGE
jgi:hypothetical protein